MTVGERMGRREAISDLKFQRAEAEEGADGDPAGGVADTKIM